MKKLLFLLIVFLLCISCFSENIILENKNICLKFAKNDNVISLIGAKDNLNSVSYIVKETPYNIWSLTCKKDRDFNGEAISLSGKDAENLSVQQEKEKIVFTWKNVKNENMTAGFDVVASVNLKGENSYWDLSVSENSEYGLWEVEYPKLYHLDFHSNSVILPRQGGSVEKDFEGSLELAYPDLAATIQLMGMTDGDTCLYLCPEDLNTTFKKFVFKKPALGEMNYSVVVCPPDMGKAKTKYTQDYSFNMAFIKGDHYNACKKYRKWGIDNKFAPFSKGLIADRKELPDWWKKNCAFINYDAPAKEFIGNDMGEKLFPEIVKSAIKFLDVPLIIHYYWWSQNNFDTNYPNFLPAQPYLKNILEEFRSIPGVKLMPYTNALLTDVNFSDYYKKYGDDMVSIKPDGTRYGTSWGDGKAYNCNSCPAGSYKEAYTSEVKDIMAEFKFDALYMDQMCAEKPNPCFNPLHENLHPFGGGHYWVDNYKDIIAKAEANLSEIKGEYVPITSESSAECYPIDGWLRCNETFPEFAKEPLTTYIYSGYVMNFGDRYYDEEFTEDNSLPAINKTACGFVKGIQLGWNLCGWRTINMQNKANEMEAYPVFGNHLKNCIKARQAAWEYFNLGEMVRRVKFTNDIPTKKIFWQIWGNKFNQDFHLVKTCSFNYKGKTMIAFTSISEKEEPVKWKSNAEDLKLKNKKTYTIKEIYPNKKTKKNGLKGEFVLAPYETKIFVIE